MGGTPLRSARRSEDDDRDVVPASPDDAIIDLGLLQDPEAAFDRFYEEYAPRLRGLALRFRQAADLAEDLVQEVLLRAYRAELHLEPRRDPWPWLSTVCRNLAIDTGRRRDTRSERCVDAEVLTALPAPAKLVEDPEAISVMHGGDIVEALAQLDEREQRMLVLKHIRGWKYEEIAEWEGISFPALRSALSRARQKFTESYAAIVEGRSVPALVGSIIAPVARKLRALRHRIAGGEAALVQQMGAAVPGMVNAIAAAVTLGALAVVGSLLGSDGASGSEPRLDLATTVAPAHVPRVESASLGSVALEPLPTEITVGPQPVADSEISSSAGESESRTAEASPPPEPPIVVGEDGATAEAGGHTVTVDPSVEEKPSDEGGTWYITNPVKHESDRDGDGEPDGGAEAPAWVYCPPPEERGAATGAACPVVQHEEQSQSTALFYEEEPVSTADELL